MLSFHSLGRNEQCGLCVQTTWSFSYTVSLEGFAFQSWTFQNSEHLITLSQAFSLKMEKEKGGGGGETACQDLCQLNLISLGICFSSGVRLDVQIKQCLRVRGNVHGILSEANPKAAHSKGLICPSSLLTWNVSWGKSRASDFFFQWAVIRALLTGWPAPDAAKWKQQELLVGLPLPPPRISAQVKRFQLTFLLFNFPIVDQKI